VNSFLNARVFSAMPRFDTIAYQGAVVPKLLKFTVGREQSFRLLFLSSVVSAEEKVAWKSFQDLLGYSGTLAQSNLSGLFGLDVLCVNIREGIRHFRAQEYASLLVNHSRNLGSEHKALVRYGQIFAVLHKRAPADWGKIDIQTHVEIIHPDKTGQASHIRKIRRAAGNPSDAIYLIHDLSSAPLWKQEDPTAEVPPEVYIHAEPLLE